MTLHIPRRVRSARIAVVACAVAGVGTMLYLARDSEFLSCYTGAIANDRLDDAHQMVEDGLLLGLSADDLAALLGPPSGGKTFIGFDQGYYLRPDGICIDSEWLAVRFDGEGRVETAEIYFD